MKSRSILVYKIIAILSFLILLGVQFFLVYNTYQLEDEQYFSTEKQLIKDVYSKSIRNDKLYPGGQAVLDPFLERNMKSLETLYHRDQKAFNIQRQLIVDSLFKALRQHSPMDGVFQDLLKQNHLKRDLKYRLIIKTLSITFTGNNYIILYQNGGYNPRLDTSYQLPEGMAIAGTLQTPNKQNLVSSITVSSPEAYSYQINFQLYVDTPNRAWFVLGMLKPTFALSFFSLLAVMTIYFFTFRNWLRQKKLAEMKSDFVNSITHEFHTPLATIMVANKSLQNQRIIEQKENIAPLTEIISRQTQRLKTIFSQVLDITVMNNATLKKTNVNLKDLLEEIILDYRLTLNSKNVEIDIDLPSKTLYQQLDKFWFTTTILNLFENAIKYNSADIKQIKIRVEQDKKAIHLSIQDNGIGMSPKAIRHIFEKFYRDKHASTEDVNGLGLGLYYVKQCIQAHGWMLHVDSKEAQGSTFTIIMPIA